jgi:hypothetical protein
MNTLSPCYSATAALLCCLLAAHAEELPPPSDYSELPRSELIPPHPSKAELPGGLLPGSDPFTLLENDRTVQADLGLTEDQRRHLADTGVLFRSRLAELAQAGDAASRAEMERLEWTSRGAIARILTPRQLERLREIMLQLQGPCLAAGDPMLAETLHLSREQSQAIQAACRQIGQDMRTTFRAPPSGSKRCSVLLGNRVRIDRVRANGEARVLALLTAEQRDALDRMKGRTLALEPPMPAGCGR